MIILLGNEGSGGFELTVYLSEFTEFLSVSSDLWNANWKASVLIRCHKRDGERGTVLTLFKGLAGWRRFSTISVRL